MSDFAFFELIPEAANKLRPQLLPVPIRRERQLEIFPESGNADLAGILDEIELFLQENPQYTDVYRQYIANLCYIVGIDAATQGYHMRAAHYLMMGLDAVPNSITLRSHYALALQCLGRYVEARNEMELVVVETPQNMILPVLWMMLARIYARDGEYALAYALLKDLSTIIEQQQDSFRDFLAEMQAKAGIYPTQSPPAVPISLKVAPPAPIPASPAPLPLDSASGAKLVPPLPRPKVCSNCNNPVGPNAKFCGGCGTPVEKVTAPPPPPLPPKSKVCPNCNKIMGLTAKFCSGCGKPV